MKRSNIRAFILGVLVTVIVMSTAAPAVASTMKAAQLYYNNIKIRLNGEELIPKDATGKVVEPFAIDGTTYLPIRAISSALGLNVSWDGATQTVVLGNDPEYNQPAMWLKDMQTSEGSTYVNYQGYKEDYYLANNGKEFDNYIRFAGNKTSYLLNGEYTKFTGTFYLADVNKNDEGWARRFKIYVDDVLVYTSEPIKKGVMPQEFEIDVTDAYKLTITCEARQEIPPTEEWINSSTQSNGPELGDAALWND